MKVWNDDDFKDLKNIKLLRDEVINTRAWQCTNCNLRQLNR